MTRRRDTTQARLGRSTRAFTLLEVVLASLISMLVLAGALSLYFFVDGTDRRLQRRYEDVNNLQRIHLVMERVCTTLVMSDRSQAVRGNTSLTPADLAGVPASAGRGNTAGDSRSSGTSPPAPSGATSSKDGGSKSTSGSGSGGSSDDKGGGTPDSRPGTAAPRVPPRVLLTPDSTFSAEAAALSTIITGPSEGPGAQRLMTQPQRLEVAVSSSPVPSSVSPAALEAARRAASASRDSTSSSTREDSRNYGPRDTAALLTAGEGDDEEEVSSRVIRGALELRPQRTRSRTARAGAPEQVLWELWWVPLAPRRDVEPDAPVPPPIGDPYLVASDIAYLQYRMFDDRSRKTTFYASFMQDIPAYVEVEVETARGLKANWLFEVSWSIGNELPPEQAGSNAADGANKDPKASGSPTPTGGKGDGGKGGGK